MIRRDMPSARASGPVRWAESSGSIDQKERLIMSDLPQYAFRVSTRELPENDHAVPLHRGDVVTSFRGEDYTFEGVARPAYGNSSGRVAVSRPCPDAYDTDGGRACPHMWHRDGIDREEYFPAVFNLYLGTLTGEPA